MSDEHVQPTTLDSSQWSVLERGLEESLAVVGAPGSGRTTVLIELAARAVAGGARPDQILVLAADRRGAAVLRDRLDARLRTASAGGTLGRTAASVAIEIIGDARARAGERAPKLLTGSMQDAIVAELLDGGAEDPGDGSPAAAGLAVRGAGPRWPHWLESETLRLPAMRLELRALLTAMTELGVSPARLRELALPLESDPLPGQRHRVAWTGGADFAETYFDVLDQGYEGAYDVPGALVEATALLDSRRRPATGAFAGVRHLLVDDAQELTLPALGLLRAFERAGAKVVTFGDPDIATGTFHGGRAEGALGWRDPGETQPERIVLDSVYRHGPEIRGAVSRITGRIGTRGAGRQRAAISAAPAPGTTAEVPPAASVVTASTADEASMIAGYLRSLHLQRGVPWSQMAVLVRTGSRLPSLQRGLERADVPSTSSAPLPAAADPAAAAVLDLGAAAVTGRIDSDTLMSVLVSPLGGLDPLELRRVRRAARHEEALVEGERSAPRILADGMEARMRGDRDEIAERALDSLAGSGRPGPAARVRAIEEALGRMIERRDAGDPIDTILFEAWRDRRRAEEWQRIALEGGSGAAAMNRRLDALVVLFDRAKRFVEREPDAPLSAFLAEWQRDQVTDDSLAHRAAVDAVTLTTPSGAVGYQWRVVVVAGVDDGIWPNLRVRDSLLGAGRLAEALEDGSVSSILDRRADVLADESRMLAQACSRAREHLLVTAVEGGDSRPSPFFARLALPPLPDSVHIDAETEIPYRRLGFGALVAELRRDLAGIGDRTSHHSAHPDHDAGHAGHAGRDADTDPDAVAALARLADAGARGAEPDTWPGTRGRTTEAPLAHPDHDGVLRRRLSPSGIDRFADCGVRWYVDLHAGSAPSAAMTVGTLIHDIAEHEGEFADEEEMRRYLDTRIGELDFAAEWIAEAERSKIEEAAHALWRYVRRPGSTRIGTEREFAFPLDGDLAGTPVEVTVSGRIDRLELLDGNTDHAGVRIVDFKTGKNKPTKDAVGDNGQLRAYQLAFDAGALGDDIADEALAGPALVFPRAPLKDGLASSMPQPPLDDAGRSATRSAFVEVALEQAGINPRDSDPLHAPPAFTADPAGHCLAAADSCRIQFIDEVTA